MANKKHLIFVYGTLRRGYGNNRRLIDGKANFLSKGMTVEKYTLSAAGIPYVNTHVPRTRVVGEVWEVDNDCLASVDRLEGYNPSNHNNSWYKRVDTEIELKNGKIITAGMYENDTIASHIIETGDYAKYRAPRNQNIKTAENA